MCVLIGLFQHLLFRTLGTCLAIADPPDDQKLSVLNDVWKPIMKLKNPAVSYQLHIVVKQLSFCVPSIYSVSGTEPN